MSRGSFLVIVEAESHNDAIIAARDTMYSYIESSDGRNAIDYIYANDIEVAVRASSEEFKHMIEGALQTKRENMETIEADMKDCCERDGVPLEDLFSATCDKVSLGGLWWARGMSLLKQNDPSPYQTILLSDELAIEGCREHDINVPNLLAYATENPETTWAVPVSFHF